MFVAEDLETQPKVPKSDSSKSKLLFFKAVSCVNSEFWGLCDFEFLKFASIVLFLLRRMFLVMVEPLLS